MSEANPYVVLVRHAQSQWNLENRFTGWADPPLTESGVAEADTAGRLLAEHKLQFDLGYTSRLQRAITTMTHMLTALGQTHLPVVQDWRLNERHYGSLTGKIKTPEANNTTAEQIWRWRRSYLDNAPPLALDDERHPRNDALYQDVDPELLPGVENLKQTRERVMAFWEEKALPQLQQGKSLLISSHGNTLRGLLMALANMSVDEVESFEIPTGNPMKLQFNDALTLTDWHYLKAKS